MVFGFVSSETRPKKFGGPELKDGRRRGKEESVKRKEKNREKRRRWRRKEF